MASNVAVLLISLSTILFSIASFQAVESQSFESSILVIVIGGLVWAAGAASGYFVPAIRQSATKSGLMVRWIATGVFATAVGVWPWFGPDALGCVSGLVAMFCSGILISSIVSIDYETPETMRDAYGKSLIGSALGAALSAALFAWKGPGAMCAFAAAAAFLAPLAQSSLYFSTTSDKRRWIVAPLALLMIGLSFAAPGDWSDKTSQTTYVEPFAVDAVFQLRTDRKLDVYMLGAGSLARIANEKPDKIANSIRSLSVVELHPENTEVAVPSVVDFTLNSGSARRRLAAETRRFDLIQIQMPTDTEATSRERLGARSEGALTVEALRLYFDRLKDDGVLQILGRSTGAKAQSTLATIGEAWKKSARREVDLHAVAATSEGGKSLETVIVRMKPFLREERDKLGEILKIGKGESGVAWMLVSDAAGEVLTDDRPFVGSVAPASASSRAVMWIAILAVLGLIAGVAMQERRKGLASRWQTASMATYFGGLGMSFALFQVFFVLRAVRGWGMPTIASSLVLSAIFVSLAAGAILLPGHPRRRYGVRIQPLANFVFAVMFTYLGAALFEPLVATGSEWLSAFVGMSVLIPFGLFGGSFLPNALEESSAKLAPRVLFLLWSLFMAGTALGIYAGVAVGVESGLDVVFLAGLFCFAWVAIFSGLVRPWNVRKASASSDVS